MVPALTPLMGSTGTVVVVGGGTGTSTTVINAETGDKGILSGNVAFLDVQVVTRSKSKAEWIAEELRNVSQDVATQAKYVHEMQAVGARRTSHLAVTGIVLDEVWRRPNDPPPKPANVTWIPITMQAPPPHKDAASRVGVAGGWGAVVVGLAVLFLTVIEFPM